MTAKPLKIYADPQYAPRLDDGSPGYTPLVGRFWLQTPPSSVMAAYDQRKHDLFEITTSPAGADAAVLPGDWNFYRVSAFQSTDATALAQRFADVARQHHLPLFVFHHADNDLPIPLDAIIFRTSAYASQHPPKTLGLPSWSSTITDKMPLRPWERTPVIGFCGSATRSTPRKRLWHWGRMVRQLVLRRQPVYASPRDQRARALDLLRRSPRVATHFIIRSQYYGGAQTASTEAEVVRIQSEYRDNMRDSDYTLCMRGNGNYSIRFYETLCAGRIPLFVNTDCLLPYADEVNWRTLFPWVEARDLARIADTAADFHAGLSADAFTALQIELRALWETWLSPHGFFAKLPLALEKYA
ncbi:MAG: exostosin family protein [bacterium]|nr:exostosin family protein [bacterium]